MLDAVCLSCSIPFRYCPSKRRGKYCSNQCFQDHNFLIRTLPRIEDGSADCKTIRLYHLRIDPTCKECGIGSEWNGKPLSLQLDHKDGNSDNNLPDNVWLLCPNCHSQTPTYGIKNRGSTSRRANYLRKHREYLN